LVSSTFTQANAPEVSRVQEMQGPYPWIINPGFDFFFIAGGAVWVLFAINYLFLGMRIPIDPTSGPVIGRWLIVLTLIGQHLTADSHNAATYLRIYGSEKDKKQFRFYGKWLALSCIPLFFFGINVPGLAGALVYTYLVTVIWHYAAQSFGISLIYCYKAGYYFSNTEKEIFRWFTMALAGVVITRLLTFRDFSPRNFYGVECPYWGPLPLWFMGLMSAAFITLTAAFLVVVAKKAIVERKYIPFASLLCMSTVALLGLSWGTVSAILWLYVPCVYHGTQYLAVTTSYYLKERGLPEGISTWDIGTQFLKGPALSFIGMTILIGCFLYIGIPHIFSSLGYNQSVVAGVVLATVNYHHFITDAAIWRLKDPACRKLLLA